MSRLQKFHRTDGRIGETLGVSRQAVHQLRKKLGVRTRQSDRKSRDAEIVAAYIAGETGIGIARRLGLSISQTYRVINAANGKAKRAARKAAGKSGIAAPAKKTPGRKPSAKKAAAKKKPGRKPGVKKAVKKTPGRKPGVKKTAKKTPGRKPAAAKKTAAGKKRKSR
jgi:hypothetical protein